MILRFRNVRFVSQVQLFRNSYSSPPSSSTFSLVSGVMSSSLPPALSRPRLFLPTVSNYRNSFTTTPRKHRQRSPSWVLLLVTSGDFTSDVRVGCQLLVIPSFCTVCFWTRIDSSSGLLLRFTYPCPSSLDQEPAGDVCY